VNSDDVTYETEPTAVTVASFDARPLATGVVVRSHWHRSRPTRFSGRPLARPFLAAHQSLAHRGEGLVSGAAYRFLDKTAKRGVSYWYRIKSLNRDGTASWFGPVRVT